MKTYFKKIFFITSLVLIIPVLNLINLSVKALNMDDILEKKEDIISEKINLPESFKNTSFVYIKDNKNISYINKETKETVAVADITSNFRCNNKNEKSEYLSSFNKCASYDPNYYINISSRSGSKNTSIANSLSTVELKRNISVIDKFTIDTSCDHFGNITYVTR